MTTPLDFEKISAEREARLKRLELDNQKQAAGIDAERPLSTLELQKPDPLDNFTVATPSGFDSTGILNPNELAEKPEAENPLDQLPSFGRGAVGFLSDVRGGTVKNVPGVLKPFAFPFVKAGQGVLAGLEWGGNVARSAAPPTVDKILNYIPGKQELESLVAEKQKAGQSYTEAVQSSWDEIGFGSLSLPFPTTAFTPSGSVTLGFKEVIEVGFDPIELILAFATGGTATGTGVLAAAAGKRSVAAGLKTAVGQSIGVRGGRYLTGRGLATSRFVGSEARTGLAGTREAVGGLSNTGELLDRGRKNVSEILHPNKARDARGQRIRHYEEPETVAPGVLPEEDLIEQVTTKDWRFENLLNKLPESIRGAETSQRYQLVSGLGRQTFDRIVKLADPSAVIGENDVAKASVLRETTAARLSQQIGVGMSYVDRELFDQAFNVDQFGRSRALNVKLTPEGWRQFRQAFKNAKDPDALIESFENEGFMMGDILEFALADIMERVTKTKRIAGRKRTVAELQEAGGEINFGDLFGDDIPARFGKVPEVPVTKARLREMRAKFTNDLSRDPDVSLAAAARNIVGNISENATQGDTFATFVSGSNRLRVTIEDIVNRSVRANEKLVNLIDEILAGGERITRNAQRGLGDLDEALVNLDLLRTERGVSKIGLAEPDVAPIDVFPREQLGTTRSRANSWFTGLTPEQNLALDRFHKFNKDWLELGLAEEALDVADGKLVGFKFGDEATEEFGDIREAHHYAHRELISQETWDVAGETQQLMMRRETGQGFGAGRSDFTKHRQFGTMEEGVRDVGALYAHPMEAAESMAITIAQLIADKRAMSFLKRKNIAVTSKDAFERMFPRMMEDISLTTKAKKAALANVNRLERKIAGRKSKRVHVTGSKSQVVKSVDELKRLARQTNVATNQAQGQMIRMARMQLGLWEKQAAYTEALKLGGTPKRTLNQLKAQRNNARKAYNENRRIFNEKVGVMGTQSKREKAAARRLNTQQNHVQKFEAEFIGITDDLTVAYKEYDLVTATLDTLTQLRAKRMDRIIGSRDMQLKAFGEVGEDLAKRRVPITHFTNGPLANSFAPESVAKELEKTFGDQGIEAFRRIEQVTGTARTLAAGSADIGWMGIQGSLLAATHPRAFAKAAINSLEAVLQPGRRDEYIRQNLPEIMDFLKNGGDIGSSEFFTAIDRTGLLSTVTNWLTVKEGKTPKWVPGATGRKIAPRGSRVAKMTELWGRDVKPLGRLGTGFNTFVDIAKIELWKSFNPMLSANLLTRREIATYVNNVMGTLNSQMLGVRQTQRQIEGGMLLFSPRFTRSAFAVTGQAMKAMTGGAKGAGQLEGLASREAVRSISGMLAGGTFVMAGIAAATGQWEEFKRNGLDPMKPGWMTVEIGGQRVGIGGSTRALLDMVFKSTAAMAEMNGRDAQDLAKWNIFDPLHRAQNPIPNFWLNRTAPGIREIMLGETFEGQGLDTPAEHVIQGIAPKFMPFAAQNFLQPGQGNSHPGLIAAVPESVGLRARPLSVFERRAALRDELALTAFNRKWEDLDVDERNQVQSLDQDNGGRLNELNELVETVESPTVGAYFNDRKAIQDSINEEMQKAVLRLTSVHRNGRTFKEDHDRLVREARNSRIRLEESETHADAIEYLDERRQARMDGETFFNQLYDEYTDKVKNIDNYVDETTGVIDWDERDKREQDWKKRLVDEFGETEGETLYTRMRNNYVGRDINGERFKTPVDYPGEEMVWALRDARELLNSVRYWQQAKDVIGNNPTMLQVWAQFEISDPLTREAMKKQYRGIARIERQVKRRRDRLRRNNPEIDQALIDWYGHRAGNRSNIRAERAELQRLRRTV